MAGRLKQAVRAGSALALASIALAISTAAVAAGESTASLGGSWNAGGQPVYLTVGDATRAPIGWVDFCMTYKVECATRPSEPRDVALNAKAGTGTVKGNERPNESTQRTT